MLDGREEMPPAAAAAQAIAEAQARAAEGDTLPEPPAGLPALRSVDGAQVLGYSVRTSPVLDCYGPDGKMRVPGDAGFYDAQLGRLRFAPMPSGWRFEKREARILYAVVAGNPIMLEESARQLGYSRALADSPNALRLGEID